MEPLKLVIAITIVAVACILLIVGIASLSRETEPSERRRRTRTRYNVEAIGRAYRSGSLSLPQAVMRMREIEAPVDAVNRVLVEFR